MEYISLHLCTKTAQKQSDVMSAVNEKY